MTSPISSDASNTVSQSPARRTGSIAPFATAALRRRAPLGASGAVVLGVLLWTLLSPDIAQIKIASTVLMYVALASAWNLLGGYVGYSNFGSVMFMGLGAYTTAILATRLHLNPLMALPAAALVAGAGALLIGIPGFRLRGDYFAVATFVLTLALNQLAMTLPLTGGANGLLLDSPVRSLDTSVRLFCVLFLVAAVLATALCWLVERTRWHGALVAVREDEDAAEVLGIPTMSVKLTALVVGAAIAGLVGCIYASELLYIEPTGTFDFQVSLAVVVAAVIGGKGTWYGPVIGAVLTQLTLQQLLVNVEGTWNQFVFGAVLVVVVLTAPRGIAGMFNTKRGRRFGV